MDLVLLDVTPHSLGIECVGEVFSIIINRNTPIPIKLTKPFYTVDDNQTRMRIGIYEGEHLVNVKRNNLLGEFLVQGIPRARSGMEQVNVTMEIDADGILKVNAVSTSNGVNNKITIEEYKTRLSQSEIDENIKKEKLMKMH